MRRRNVVDVVLQVLEQTGNDAVMSGDSGLLDTIADRWKWVDGEHPIDRHQRVLNAIDSAIRRGDGRLVKRHTRARRLHRVFRMAG